MKKVVVLVAAVVVLLGACGSETAAPKEATTTTRRTTTSFRPTTTTTAAPTTRRSTTTAAQAQYDERLQGIGQTVAQWKAKHTPVTHQPGTGKQLGKGCCYGPTLIGGQSTYGGVVDNGLAITSYDFYVDHKVTRSEAEGIIRRELPTDARLLRSGIVSGCAVDMHDSDAVKTSTGDPEAVVLVIVPHPSDQEGRYTAMTFYVGAADDFESAC